MLIQRVRFFGSVAVWATVCATMLVKSYVCVTEEDGEVLEKEQLTELYKKGLFIIESEPLKRCITVDRSNLVLEDCEQPTRRMLWKWVSRQRLFNVGTSKCLGLNISDITQPLGTFDCDMTLPVLWWRCRGNMLYSASQWKVAVTGRLVVVKKNSYHVWKRYNTPREGPCSYPYDDIHTLLGNAHGMPCALPFRYNNKWYSECTTEGREDHLLWCATSTRFDLAERWGFCPMQDTSCEHFWESNQKLQACYQFNLYTILTWSQALSTCQAQGGNLLSITSLAENRYIRDRLAVVGARVWIGLNHLKDGQGWQWSGGAPLSLVNFTTALPASPLQVNRQCGVYNSAYEGQWQSLPCESALPYICKKTPNNTQRAEPLENWQYIPTECSEDWWPHNGFCYRLLSETGNWEESSRACGSHGANLMSIHYLSEVEMLINLLANYSGESIAIWIGLHKQSSLPAVEWSDGSPVTLTLWHKYHPPNNVTDAPLCAKVDKKEGNWLLTSCDERLPALCRRESQNHSRHIGTWDEGCPEGWKRHGHSCYTVTSHEKNYDDALMGYFCEAPLIVENRFEQEFVNSLLSEHGATEGMYYWIGLVDLNKNGEYHWLSHNGSSLPLTFSNWNKHQPVSAGGCVAISGGPALGHWEVKDCKSHKAFALCKQSISSYHDVLLTEHHFDADAPCPPGWESRTGLFYCYKVFHDEKVLMKRSWVEADFFCQALGTNLASFYHYEEQVFVKRLLGAMFEGAEGRWFWVGLNKRDPEDPGAWEWSDGTPVVTSFMEDKNEEDDRRDCAVYSDLTNTLMPQRCDTKHEWICKVARGVELTKPYWYMEQSEPWVFYRGAEYLLAKQPFDWDSVSLACQMMGAYLLSIHSREELHFIKERLQRLSLGPTDWWIGLSIGQPGEEISWSDKTEVEFQNWAEVRARGGPRNKRVCVTMSSSSGKWFTGPCSDLHGYVCKRKTVSVVETPREPHYIGGCPENWLYFGHKCLMLHLPGSPKEGKSWNDAQSICSSFEGSLVTIEDEIEQAYITMLLQGSSVGVWIGLQNEDTIKWINGKQVSYTNWSPIEPKSYLTEDEWLSGFADEPMCTVLSNNHNFHLTGKWYDEKCSESGYGFVCQKPQDTSKPPTHSYHPLLPHNIEYRSRSYKVVSGNMSWYDAMHMCTETDSDLVSVTDAYHQAFLTVLVNRLAAPHWIGLYSQDNGINYHWSDGSDTVYTHWDATDDDEDIVTGDCVYMDVSGGWRRADCESLLPGALCHVPPPSSKPFISYDVTCPSSWVKFGQGCYNFEPMVHQLTFNEAREHCMQKVNTSDVLTIESEQENRFVLEQLWSSGFLHNTVWLGMNFNIDTDSMAWVDGSPIDYTNWPSNAPESKLLTADSCVTTRAVDGVWHLSECTVRNGFICKTISNINTEVEVEPLNGLHHGVIPAAVLVAVLVFALLAGAMWFVYKRNISHFQGLPTLGSAYYRQSSSQATESDGNVLITDLDGHSGE